jgi:hypothetical protein
MCATIQSSPKGHGSLPPRAANRGSEPISTASNVIAARFHSATSPTDEPPTSMRVRFLKRFSGITPRSQGSGLASTSLVALSNTMCTRRSIGASGSRPHRRASCCPRSSITLHHQAKCRSSSSSGDLRKWPSNKPLKLPAAALRCAGAWVGSNRSHRARPQLSGHPLGGRER